MHFTPPRAELATRFQWDGGAPDGGRGASSIARGLRNKEIARELGLSEATVKYHAAHLFEKLGVSGRTEALLKAQKLGLITSEYDD
jgi:hypothetical protein